MHPADPFALSARTRTKAIEGMHELFRPLNLPRHVRGEGQSSETARYLPVSEIFSRILRKDMNIAADCM